MAPVYPHAKPVSLSGLKIPTTSFDFATILALVANFFTKMVPVFQLAKNILLSLLKKINSSFAIIPVSTLSTFIQTEAVLPPAKVATPTTLNKRICNFVTILAQQIFTFTKTAPVFQHVKPTFLKDLSSPTCGSVISLA